MDNGILLYLLILLVGALSSFVQRVSGFGSGIVNVMNKGLNLSIKSLVTSVLINSVRIA